MSDQIEKLESSNHGYKSANKRLSNENSRLKRELEMLQTVQNPIEDPIIETDKPTVDTTPVDVEINNNSPKITEEKEKGKMENEKKTKSSKWDWLWIVPFAVVIVIAGILWQQSRAKSVAPTAAIFAPTAAATAAPVVKPTVAPIVAPVAQPTKAPVVEATCPTTGEAQALFGVNVQRIDTEPCGWVWRGKPSSHTAVCPTKYVCTWDVVNDITVVHLGIDQKADIYAGTFRLVKAYSPEDDVYDVCKLYLKEKDFASREVPSFEVRFQAVPNLGPQTCPEQ